MASFSVFCPTCQSSLRVADENAIGQILPCPKCNSMVLIERPTEEVGETTETAVAPPTAEDDVAVHQAPVVDVADPQDDLAAVDPVEPVESGVATTSEDASTEAVHSSEKSFEKSDELTEESAPSDFSDGDWSAPSPSMRQLVLTGAAGLLGVILALLVFSYFVFRKQDVTNVSRPDESEPIANASETSHEDSSQLLDFATLQSGSLPESSDVDEQSQAEPGPSQELTPPEQGLDDPHASESVALQSDKDAPPGFESKSVEREGAADTAINPAVDKLLTELAKDSEGDALSEENLSDLEEPAQEDKDEYIARLEKPHLSRPPPRNVDIDAQLAMKLVAIEFEKTPLADFVELISSLSTLPITLNVESLALKKLTPESTITTKMEDVTIAEILGSGLAPHDLTFERTPHGLYVTIPKAATARKVSYDLSDLATQFPGLDDWICQYVLSRISADSWLENGGPQRVEVVEESLVVTHTLEIHFEILRLCERMRVACGLNPRFRFPQATFNLKPKAERARERLGTKFTLNFGQPQRLTKILKRLADDTDSRIVINWEALHALQWNSNAEAKLIVDGALFSETLEQLLGPMELGYRIVDSKTIEITSQNVLHDRQEIEFYPLAGLADEATEVAAVITQIYTKLAEQEISLHRQDGHIQSPPGVDYLVVSLTQPQHSRLWKILQQWEHRD